MIAVLILAVGGLAGWRQQLRYQNAVEVHREVVAEAGALGVSTEVDAGEKPQNAKIAQRQREAHEEEARSFARRLIAFAKEMKEIEGQGEPPGEETQKRIFEIIGGLLDLDGSQLKLLVEEIRNTPELDDQARGEITGFVIMMMAQDHPRQALAMFTESSDLLEQHGMGEHLVAASLGRWAADDPMGALEWIRRNGDEHPDLVTDRAKSAVIGGAARQDPKLAIQLIGELEIESGAGHQLAEAAVSAESRDRLLAALRAQDDEELRLETLSSMSAKVAAGGFDEAEAWLDGAELSEDEVEAVATGLSHWQTKGDTGRWIEWIGGRVEGSQAESRIRILMQEWTSADYRTAGEWLAGAEEGAAKRSAVKGYVQAVTPYDPDTAGQWVATLPRGSERQDVARQVYTQWKEKDEAAARAFAEGEGLEVE